MKRTGACAGTVTLLVLAATLFISAGAATAPRKVAAILAPRPAEAAETVQIGVVPSGTLVPFIVAQRQGLFQKHGVVVEVKEFSGGGEITQGVVTGALPMGTFTVSTVLDLVQRGQNLKSVVLIQKRPINAIVTRKQLNIAPGDWKALRGKKIGITSPGSASDTLVRLLLSQNGINPDTEVQLVSTGGLDVQRAALSSGRVDAQVTFDPGFSLFTLASQLSLANVFLDFRLDSGPDPLPNLLQSAVATSDKYLAGHREAVEGVVKGLACAQKAMAGDPRLIREAFQQIFPGLAAEVYDSLVKNESPVYASEITPQQLDIVNETYVKAGTLKGKVPYEKAVATEFRDAWKCRE